MNYICEFEFLVGATNGNEFIKDATGVFPRSDCGFGYGELYKCGKPTTSQKVEVRKIPYPITVLQDFSGAETVGDMTCRVKVDLKPMCLSQAQIIQAAQVLSPRLIEHGEQVHFLMAHRGKIYILHVYPKFPDGTIRPPRCLGNWLYELDWALGGSFPYWVVVPKN